MNMNSEDIPPITENETEITIRQIKMESDGRRRYIGGNIEGETLLHPGNSVKLITCRWRNSNRLVKSLGGNNLQRRG